MADLGAVFEGVFAGVSTAAREFTSLIKRGRLRFESNENFFTNSPHFSVLLEYGFTVHDIDIDHLML